MLDNDFHALLAASLHWAQWEASACNNICTGIEFQLRPCTVRIKALLSLALGNVDCVFKQSAWNQLLFPNIISLRVYVLCVCIFLLSSPSLTHFHILCWSISDSPWWPSAVLNKINKNKCIQQVMLPMLIISIWANCIGRVYCILLPNCTVQIVRFYSF